MGKWAQVNVGKQRIQKYSENKALAQPGMFYRLPHPKDNLHIQTFLVVVPTSLLWLCFSVSRLPSPGVLVVLHKYLIYVAVCGLAVLALGFSVTTSPLVGGFIRSCAVAGSGSGTSCLRLEVETR